jgi:glucose-1-phosphatase
MKPAIPLRFFYFDLGNVLVHFDPRRACRNLASLAGCDLSVAEQALYGSGLETLYEQGAVDDAGFLAALRQHLPGPYADADALEAIGDMFTFNASICPLVSAIVASGIPVGILSNTCPAHWRWVLRQGWGLFDRTFRVTVVSYEVRSMKPESRIYQHAASLAGVPPQSIGFIDDREENVQAARQQGWLAVRYQDPQQAARELVDRGAAIFM